jgi:diaminopimelate decarboxylase
MEYSNILKETIPELFSGDFLIITEFGRSLIAKSAIAISKVEYTKDFKNKRISTIHLGADFFLRSVYQPQAWDLHRFFLFQKELFFELKVEEKENGFTQDIAGPLCFSGDLVKKKLISTPLIEQNDWIVIKDVGAYTYSMWSRYNSRQAPSVYGFSLKNEKFEIFKQRETVEEVLQFWK